MDEAAKFSAMAERITKNAPEEFGGAFVVVPPKDAGEALEVLVLDPRQDPAQFWIFLKTKAETEIANLDAKQRAQGAFGRGR